MITIGNFSLNIPEANQDRDYFSLKHGQIYTIELRNGSDLRCAAEVSVDGKQVGIFRINRYNSLKLERPTGDTGQFTFFKEDSKEWDQIQGNKILTSDRGVISVLFKPEKRVLKPIETEWDEITPEWPVPWRPFKPQWTPKFETYSYKMLDNGHSRCESYSCISSNNSNFEAGATGLTGKSDQKFKTVADLDYDQTGFIRINTRLVCCDKYDNIEPRPLVELNIRSNNIPKPIR